MPNLRFIEEQPQILRLTTPELKGVRGPFAQNDSQSCVAYFRLRTPVANLKFIEEQPQILRLTTPELKGVRGPVRPE